MFDTWQACPEGEAPARCVTISDKCYLISLWYCYEGQIAWHKKRVLGTLNKFPEGHEFTGKVQPKDDDAKAEAIGKMSWSQEMKGRKELKHYFEPKPSSCATQSGIFPPVTLINWEWKKTS